MANLPFDPDLSALRQDCQPAERQPQPQALRISVGLQPGKFFKNGLARLGGDARAGIFYPQLHKFSFQFPAQGQFTLRGGKFCGVFQEIDEYTAGHICIYPYQREIIRKVNLGSLLLLSIIGKIASTASFART